MENKNEFDDIILEKSNKNEKIKKILMRVIALIILFLVVMIVMKLINSGDEESVDTSILPSEPVATEMQQNNGFESVPITQNEAEDQFELLRKQIQGESAETNTTAMPSEPVNVPSTQEEPSTADLQSPKPTATTPQAQPKVESKQEPKAAPKPKAEAKPEPKKEAKPVAKQADTKELFKNLDTQATHSSGLPTGLYVQVFSVSNVDAKSKELNAVKQKGYDYKLYKTTVNGKEMTKVLIGPFEKAKFDEELAKIKKEVAKGAFAFTLK